MPDLAYPGPTERLPWLPSDFSPARQKRSPRELAGWSVAGLLLLASGSYWLGTRAGERPTGSGVGAQTALPSAAKPPHLVTPAQPRAQPVPTAEPAAVVPPPVTAPTREVVKVIHEYVRVPQPIPAPANRNESPRAHAPRAQAPRAQAPQAQAQPAPAATIAAPPPQRTASVAAPVPAPLTLWPSRQVAGANGRLVQIGSFGSVEQAKLGWRHMQLAYPAVGRLPAVVVETRNSRGRRFYRFQIGTTSQAHSEVLCQRMKLINFSCAVIGLPWKEKVER